MSGEDESDDDDEEESKDVVERPSDGLEDKEGWSIAAIMRSISAR